MTSFLSHHSFHPFLPSSNFHYYPNPKPFKYSLTIVASLPARDKVIDFGKHKGKMLGTLPSTYLKWVSNNLRAREFEEWANLADQVLQDPVYNDRLEWEFAQKLLNGDVMASNFKSENVVSELLEISQRFGWDNEDKIGWKKIDFQLLGSSKGGRIPRIKQKMKKERLEVEDDGDKVVGIVEKRVERRERLRMKRGIMSNMKHRINNNEDEGRNYGESGLESYDQIRVEIYNPFPGRESLLRKVHNKKNIL